MSSYSRRSRRGRSGGVILGTANLARVGVKKGWRRITGKQPLLIKVFVTGQWQVDENFEYKGNLFALHYGKDYPYNNRLVLNDLGDSKNPKPVSQYVDWTLDRYSEELRQGDVVYVNMSKWKKGYKGPLFRVERGSGKYQREEKKKDRKNTLRFVGEEIGEEESDEDPVLYMTPEEEEEAEGTPFEQVIASAIKTSNQDGEAEEDDGSADDTSSLFPHFTI